MCALALLFGVLLVLPIGAADMPVVIALLNSYAGLASAATGFALGNNVLIIAGTLDGGVGLHPLDPHVQGDEPLDHERPLRSVRERDRDGRRPARKASCARSRSRTSATQLAYARQVVFVPGYGMATAQAQNAVRELANAPREARRRR